MGRNGNYYSVYRRKTEMPVIIHATTQECIKIMGVSLATFYCYASHTRHGTRKCKYEVYVDDSEEDKDGE